MDLIKNKYIIKKIMKNNIKLIIKYIYVLFITENKNAIF